MGRGQLIFISPRYEGMTKSMIDITLGSCLCGTVRFELHGVFDSFFLCHCSRCRKGTGSAHAANLFAAQMTIDWTSGRDSVRSYRVPDTRHERSFCARCGSALPHAPSDGLLVVPAGSIDSAINIRPGAHICTQSRADWDVDLERVGHFDHLPE